jgi:hypothetical protein
MLTVWETTVQVKWEKVYLFKDLTIVQPSRSERGSVHVPMVLLKWKNLPPFVLMSINYGAANFGKESNLNNGKCMVIGVYIYLVLKLCVCATSNPSTGRYLLIFQHLKLLIVLLRKMIYKGSFHAPKVLIKWKDWFPKDWSWKFDANVDLIETILHRKMIDRGNVRDAKVLIIGKLCLLNMTLVIMHPWGQGCLMGRVLLPK